MPDQDTPLVVSVNRSPIIADRGEVQLSDGMDEPPTKDPTPREV